LDSLPEGHKCKRLHGHNYTVELIFRGENLDEHGFIRDFDSLTGFQDWLNASVDHRHLNDVMKEWKNPHTQPRGAKPLGGGMDQRKPIAPTSENLARWICETWALVYLNLSEVRVSEGLDTWASYER
jgi:6-pyruvoyltetrahydropterin/6-carboxytetrahydropterin synthase